MGGDQCAYRHPSLRMSSWQAIKDATPPQSPLNPQEALYPQIHMTINAVASHFMQQEGMADLVKSLRKIMDDSVYLISPFKTWTVFS